MSKATYTKVDPYACIQLKPVISTYLSRVALPIRIFDGKILKNAGLETETSYTAEFGISSGTDNAIIVEMTSLFLQFIYEHFRRKRLNN